MDRRHPLFPEITDYLTQINNLSLRKEVAKEGGEKEGSEGLRFEVLGKDGETAPPL